MVVSIWLGFGVQDALLGERLVTAVEPGKTAALSAKLGAEATELKSQTTLKGALTSFRTRHGSTQFRSRSCAESNRCRRYHHRSALQSPRSAPAPFRVVCDLSAVALAPRRVGYRRVPLQPAMFGKILSDKPGISLELLRDCGKASVLSHLEARP